MASQTNTIETNPATNKKEEVPVKERNFSPKKELDKKKKKIEKLESTIAGYEEKIQELKLELDKPEVYSDFEKITTIQGEIDTLTSLKSSVEEEWLILNEELEDMIN